MIERTEAIVLKSMKYGDTSKIVTLYTRSFGKTTVIAKGARGKKSKFGSALEPMSYITAVFYKKENRDMHLLSQADLIEVHRSLNTDEAKLAVGLCIIEFLHASIHDQEQHVELFDLTQNALSYVNTTQKSEINFLIWYLIHLITLLGFEIDMSRCARCRKNLSVEFEGKTHLKFNVDQGTTFCQQCSMHITYENISVESVRAIQWLTSSSIDKVNNLSIRISLALQLVHLFHRFLQHHIHGMKRMHSLPMLESFLNHQ